MALRLDIHLQDAQSLKGNLKAREEWITFIKAFRDSGETFFPLLSKGGSFSETFNYHEILAITEIKNGR